MTLGLRWTVLVGALAVVPGGIYAVSTGETVAAVALVNVVLIVASLLIATGELGTERATAS